MVYLKQDKTSVFLNDKLCELMKLRIKHIYTNKIFSDKKGFPVLISFKILVLDTHIISPCSFFLQGKCMQYTLNNWNTQNLE